MLILVKDIPVFPLNMEAGSTRFSSYMIAVGDYLVPNALEMVLFFVPAVRKYIEISNWRIFTIFSWTQVCSSQPHF